MSTTQPKRARGLRPRRCSASSTGSATAPMEEVLVGMVDNAMLDQQQLRTLADQVRQGEESEGSEEIMITTLAEAALRSLVLGGVVWFSLNLFRVRNPHVHMTAWVVVLLASLAMPVVMHWPTVTITVGRAAGPAARTFRACRSIAQSVAGTAA